MKLSKGMYILFIAVGAVLLLVGIVGVINKSGAGKPKADGPVENVEANRVKSDNDAEAKGNQKVIDAKQRGNDFEGYMVDVFAPAYGFKLAEWNQGQTSPEGNFSEDELKPDLKIERVREGKIFRFGWSASIGLCLAPNILY